MYLFAPIYRSSSINEYKLKDYLNIESGKDHNDSLTFEYIEIENTAWKIDKKNGYQFFLGYKWYIDHTDNNKRIYATIMCFNYDVSNI